MESRLLVKFNQEEHYNRFHVTDILTSSTKNMFAITLYEETLPLVTEAIIQNGETSLTLEEGEIINRIHATILIAPENLPEIIQALEKLYKGYIGEE